MKSSSCEAAVALMAKKKLEWEGDLWQGLLYTVFVTYCYLWKGPLYTVFGTYSFLVLPTKTLFVLRKGGVLGGWYLFVILQPLVGMLLIVIQIEQICNITVSNYKPPFSCTKSEERGFNRGTTLPGDQENNRLEALSKRRATSLSSESVYEIKQCCKQAKKAHTLSSSRLPVIKKWQKGKYLGGGSFGAVYEALADDNFFFALKEVCLNKEDSQYPAKISHAEHEINFLSEFKHKNIVRYLGSQKDDSKLYIFLELVAYGSLAQLYKIYHLSDTQVSAFTRQILLALGYLHSWNVIHGDIKCANVLVDASGSVKLADFGLAKVTELNDIKSSQGSPRWMAPEIVNPRDHGYGYGIAADIWSLGCTVLEMLTRKIPYPDLEQAIFMTGNGTPPPIPSNLSRDSRDFILKCFQVNPIDRPTAAQLLEHPFIISSTITPHDNSALARQLCHEDLQSSKSGNHVCEALILATLTNVRSSQKLKTCF